MLVMEKKENVPNIELRSEEVQELMDKNPSTILRVGLSAILVFIIIILIASNYVKYPDTISFPIIVRNINNIAEVKAAKSGQLLELRIEHRHVCKDDTLAKIVGKSNGKLDTLSITAPFSGIVFPCDEFQYSNYIEKNTPLCVVVDSIKDKINAKAYVTGSLKSNISKGMVIETTLNNNPLVGKVIYIADYANPYKGTYTISTEFETPKELRGTVFWNAHTNAKIKIMGASVFDKFLGIASNLNRKN